MNGKSANTAHGMLLNLQMIADPMDDLFWDYDVYRAGEKPCLRGCLLYCGQRDLSDDIIYILPEQGSAGFPVDSFCYITTENLPGNAPHIKNVSRPFAEVFNLVISVFQRYHDFEMRLSSVVTGGGSLTDLCRIGSDFFHNPVYIHDDMFSVLAVSHHVEGMLQFEYNEKTSTVHIPLWLINEFKFDESYNRTLYLQGASVWGNDQYPYNIRSLFVNLWDGPRYCGRVLINEIGSSLQQGQFRAAEYFASYIIVLLQHLENNQNRQYRNFEETMIGMISGEDVDERDLRTMLNILDWSEGDQYLCLKLQNQDSGISIRSDSALNSTLVSLLRDCVSFHYRHQLCIVINITRSSLDPRSIRQQLAPHVRDSCMYGGISSPVDGIHAIGKGFLQADIALDYITKEDSSNWMISFSTCALSYIRESALRELPERMLAHPVLLELMEYDRANGTQYYETLRAYLFCERSIPLTSNVLIIHRTTLTYRLGKIQELTQLNLEDANLRIYLLLSFYLLDHVRNKNSK